LQEKMLARTEKASCGCCVRSIAPYWENVPFYGDTTSRGNERKIKPGAAPFKLGADTQKLHTKEKPCCAAHKNKILLS
jgi:hypothetical protein